MSNVPRHRPRKSDDASFDGSAILILENESVDSNDYDIDDDHVLDSDDSTGVELEMITLFPKKDTNPRRQRLDKKNIGVKCCRERTRLYWPLTLYLSTALLGALLVWYLRPWNRSTPSVTSIEDVVSQSSVPREQQLCHQQSNFSIPNVTDFLKVIDELPQQKRCGPKFHEFCPCQNPVQGLMCPGKKFNVSWQIVFARNKNMTRQAVQENKLDLVMVGDSITEAWHGTLLSDSMQMFTGNAKVYHDLFDSEASPVRGLALGIAMDRIPQLLYRLQHGEIQGLTPKVFWILIGTNDFGWTKCDADQIVAGNIRVVQELFLHSPTSTVVIQSLLPVGNSKEIKNWGLYSEINHRLECFAAQTEQVEFVNVTKLFLTPKNTVNETMLPDRLHPGGIAAAIWGQEIVNNVLRIISKTKKEKTGPN